MTWKSTEVEATGGSGESGGAVFAKDCVAASDDSVTFTLADGTTKITVPLANVAGFEGGFGLYEFTEVPSTMSYYINGMSDSDYSVVYCQFNKSDYSEVKGYVAGEDDEHNILYVSKPVYDSSAKRLTGTITVRDGYNGHYYEDVIGVLRLVVVDKNGREFCASRPVNMQLQAKKAKTAQDIAAALNSESERVRISLENDITTESLDVASGKEVSVGLNGKALSLAASTACVKNGSDVTFKNGTLKTAGTLSEDYMPDIKAEEDSCLELDNVKLTTGSNGGGLLAQAQGSRLTVSNSVITSPYYCFAADASVNKDDGSIVNGQDGNVTFENSEFHATAKDGTPILIDVPVSVEIYGCKFYGHKGAAVFRGGNVSVSGSTFTFDKSKLSAADNNKRNADWGQATTWLWPLLP